MLNPDTSTQNPVWNRQIVFHFMGLFGCLPTNNMGQLLHSLWSIVKKYFHSNSGPKRYHYAQIFPYRV